MRGWRAAVFAGAGALASGLGFAPGACIERAVVVNGLCEIDSDPALGCDGAVDGGAGLGGAGQDLGLTGWSCTGTARPDQDPRYIEGVPQGTVCADRGALGDGLQGSKHGYCCTTQTTSCAYNPVAICDDPTFGIQCRGANRPESLNTLLDCGNGVRQDDLINYCCSGTPQPPGCQQSDAVRCSPRLLGWTCKGSSLPKGEYLGANKSRADYYYLLCPTPTPAANVVYNNYCCYSPALVPIGGSCVQHTAVPGCAPGRFGFACYGPDTPEDDYLPMHCPEPGFAGTSAEGYPARLYCCDFQ